MQTAEKNLSHLRQLLACETLRNEGYVIVERNFQSPAGRIDIVAREEGQLVFLDVSDRRRTYTKDQQEKLRQVARDYVRQRPTVRDGVRFDLAIVRLPKGELSDISVIQHVFYQGVI